MMASVAAINNLGGYAHNPRGNLWFNDESTYGHKLLAKMGWNKGKGLGKNENGIKENVKVKFRNTNSGLGFKDDAHSNIMKTEYESILKNLASEYSCSGNTNQNKIVNNSDAKPVQRTKVVKSKLRYPKLFFGKDVAKYSEKDMKSIFICSIPLKTTEEKVDNPIIPDNKSFEGEPPQKFDTFSSSLSISDYFAKKMEEKKNHTLDKNVTAIHDETALNVEKPIQESSEIESVGKNDLAFSNEKPSKKKKKKYCISVADTKVNSSEIELCASNITEKDKVENLCDNSNVCAVENIPSQNSSRKSKKRKLSQMLENESVESSESAFFSEIKSLSPIKKKKKKHKKNSVAIPLSPVNITNENDNTSTDVHKETKNHNLLEPIEDELSNNTNCSKKRKKSKKKLRKKLKSCLKNKCGSYSFKNVSFNESVSYRIIDSEFESVIPLAYCDNLDENTASCELITSDQNNSEDGASSEEKTASCEQNSNNESFIKKQDNVPEESDEEYSSSDLPSSKSSHYNDWIESQRQALKMELYKKLLKSIKSHKILKTSNLLSIKGYGNWGYK